MTPEAKWGERAIYAFLIIGAVALLWYAGQDHQHPDQIMVFDFSGTPMVEGTDAVVIPRATASKTPTSPPTETPLPTETPTPESTATPSLAEAQALHDWLLANQLVVDSGNDETFANLTTCPPRQIDPNAACKFYVNLENGGKYAAWNPYAVFWYGDTASYDETWTDSGTPQPDERHVQK